MKEQEKELCRIQGLYRRQVRVPLLNSDADSLLTEASQYFEGEIEPQMKEDLKKTEKKLNEKIPYEDELVRSLIFSFVFLYPLYSFMHLWEGYLCKIFSNTSFTP